MFQLELEPIKISMARLSTCCLLRFFDPLIPHRVHLLRFFDHVLESQIISYHNIYFLLFIYIIYVIIYLYIHIHVCILA